MTFRVSIEFQGTLLLHMAYGNFPCSLQRNNMQKATYKRYDLHHPHHLSAEIRTLEVVERKKYLYIHWYYYIEQFTVQAWE